MAYPSTAELVAASTVEALTSLTEEQQDALREEAIGAVERFCRQKFEPQGSEEEPHARTLDGSGGEELWLDRRLEQLHSIEIHGVSVQTDDVALSERGDRLAIRRPFGGQTWATRVLAEHSPIDRRRWPSEPASVVIAGVWGWSECPAPVVTALRFHMEDRALSEAHKLAPTVRAARSLGLDQVQQGNLSLSLGRSEAVLSARARRELVDLVWRSPVAVVT